MTSARNDQNGPTKSDREQQPQQGHNSPHDPDFIGFKWSLSEYLEGHTDGDRTGTCQQAG